MRVTYTTLVKCQKGKYNMATNDALTWRHNTQSLQFKTQCTKNRSIDQSITTYRCSHSQHFKANINTAFLMHHNMLNSM